MRELTLEEQELIAGGTVTDGTDSGGDIVVTANPGDGGGGDWGDYGDGGGGGGGDGGGDAPQPQPPEPPCGDSNPATIETADGTKYDGLDGANITCPRASTTPTSTPSRSISTM
ncbi:hypothetical protein ACNFJ7_05530 [Sphingomonas sp. HT-1]|uniref:hypothetical protein n=1 Tax=unclassified Sphingomonas TaxID=196159 RepID=UPI0002FB662B|nr:MULTISPECIES: hypothetical protein [unclassified Sphingomonas]